MYAAHFAAALAIGVRAPRAPAWALLTGAFVPDLVWIALARAGAEPTASIVFFDDWSHSLLSVACWAGLFSLPFWRYGQRVVLAIWAAGVSHFLLDLPIHPKPPALYPHSTIHLGMATIAAVGPRTYWLVQSCVLAALVALYVSAAGTRGPRRLVAASCVLVAGLHLLMYPS